MLENIKVEVDGDCLCLKINLKEVVDISYRGNRVVGRTREWVEIPVGNEIYSFKGALVKRRRANGGNKKSPEPEVDRASSP